MANLIVKFKNMCVFGLGKSRSEAWYPKNEFHSPFLGVAGLRLPSSLQPGQAGLPISGFILSFLDDGKPLPSGGTALIGQHTSVLPHLNKLLTADLVLEPALAAMTETTLAPSLFCKIALRGGTLLPQALNSPGGEKQWHVSDQVSTRFCEDAVYTVPVASSNVALRLTPVSGGASIDVPISSTNGDFVISVSSENLTGATMMEQHEAVVFLTEFILFQPVVSGQVLRSPFTFWPDFKKETDPNGGPCMMIRLDLAE